MLERLELFRELMRSRSPLALRLASGAAWSAVGAAISSGLVLCVGIYIARNLGKETYGQLIIIQGTLSALGVVAGFGIGGTAIRYIAEMRLNQVARLTRILALLELAAFLVACLMAAALMFGSRFVAVDVLKSPALALPLALSAVSLLFVAMDNYQRCVLIGFEEMKANAIGTLIGMTIGLPFIVILTNLYGLNGAAVGLVFSAFVQSVVSRFQVRTQFRLRTMALHWNGCSREWRVLRDFALPSLMAGLFVAPAHWVAQAILANSHGGYAELAVLGVAMQWFNIALFFPSVAGRVILPIVTERLLSGHRAQAMSVIKMAVVANVLVSVPLATIIGIASPHIMEMYGDKFRSGWAALALASFIAILVVAAMPIGQMIAARNKMWVGACMNLAWATVFVIGAWILVDLGSLGVVTALGVAYIAHTAWVVLYVHRLSGKINRLHKT